VAEFDRVLGGGLVPGSVVLVGGEPGVGKSTLLLDVAARAARAGLKAVYVTGEETAHQVSLRAKRIGALHGDLKLATSTDLDQVRGLVDTEHPGLMVLDSVQTLTSRQHEGAPGGVGHVRAVTAALVQLAKAREMTLLLVGHVTKDGSVAGPRTLEHLVDVVTLFEGERSSSIRTLRCSKNRFGPSDEVGCFELGPAGITGVVDPSGMFVDTAGQAISGSCIGVTMEGRRPIAVEVQALVAPSSMANPRRTTSGVDSSRLAMVLAVLSRRCGLAMGGQDVYASTVGGKRLNDPAFDLALAMACASARWDLALPPGTAALGEVSLGGQIRPVTSMDRRLAEAARMGLANALVPPGVVAGSIQGQLNLIEVADLAAATRQLRAVTDQVAV
jgi:DNA repair protein RadA/Sms